MQTYSLVLDNALSDHVPTKDPEILLGEARAHFGASRFQEAARSVMTAEIGFKESASVTEFGNSPIKPHASIIVLSYKETPKVAPCIEAIANDLDDRFGVMLVNTGNDRIGDYGKKYLKGFTYVDIGINVGCSIARNIAARCSDAENVIFIDDDGILESGSLNALLSCLQDLQAFAVRGRVIASSSELGAVHYDRGDLRMPSFPNCECISAWKREAFLAVGGFDPLLVGHEGAELCWRIMRRYETVGFYYEPDAVLYHDFSASLEHRSRKKAGYDFNEAYLSFKGMPPIQDLKRKIGDPGYKKAKGIMHRVARTIWS